MYKQNIYIQCIHGIFSLDETIQQCIHESSNLNISNDTMNILLSKDRQGIGYIIKALQNNGLYK